MLMTKVPVYSAQGKASGEVLLPATFDEEIHEDLIKRAAIADQTQYYQPKGSDIWAGMKTSARYKGRKEDYGSAKNHGIAMLPREIQPKGRFGRVRRIPSSVKGRRAHPPHVDKVLIEKINKKEYAKALRSAVAATGSAKQVARRGHLVASTLKLPIVLDASVESIMKSKQAETILNTIGLSADLARSKVARARTGVGARKGGVKRAKSVLVVVGAKDCGLIRAARNIAGVNVVAVSQLKVLDLAPGAKAGRLTAFTKTALDALDKRNKDIIAG